MTEIINGKVVQSDVTSNAKGGTELMANRMVKYIPKELLEEFQIIHSRPRELLEDRKKIFVCHDLPQDPEVAVLKNGGWKKFDKIVFVSDWQAQMYNVVLGVPYSHSVVISNFIEPIQSFPKKSDKINVIYFSTPHRGLRLLVPAFEEVAKHFDNLHLNVYSSFKIYGWESRDAEFATLFDKIKAADNMSYFGSVSNDEIRKALADNHIFAYPSTYLETSCLSLIEAMSAGLVCVHPNLAALPETSKGFTRMYQWSEDMNEHVNAFAEELYDAVEDIDSIGTRTMKDITKIAINLTHSVDVVVPKWVRLLRELKGA